MLILHLADQDIVNELSKSMDIPWLDLNKCFIQRTIIDRGKVVLVGLIKLSSEVILLSGNGCSKFIKGKALIEMNKELVMELNTRKIDECHAFISNDKVGTILEKMKFKPSKSDRVMVWINNGD